MVFTSHFTRWFSRPAERAAHRDRPQVVAPARPAVAAPVNQTSDDVFIQVKGDARVEFAGALQDALLALAARRPAVVTLDLSELCSISSLAMGVLVSYRRSVVRAGGRVRLAAALQPAVKETLVRAEVLELFETATEAQAPNVQAVLPLPHQGIPAAVQSLPPQPTEGSKIMKSYPHFQDLERAHGVTWHDLVDLEPQLAELLWAARRACATCRRWSDVAQAFAPLRNTLVDLVGFSCAQNRHPILGSAGAYEVAHWRLYDSVAGLLPPPDRAGRETTPNVKAALASPDIGTLQEAAPEFSVVLSESPGSWDFQTTGMEQLRLGASLNDRGRRPG